MARFEPLAGAFRVVSLVSAVQTPPLIAPLSASGLIVVPSAIVSTWLDQTGGGAGAHFTPAVCVESATNTWASVPTASRAMVADAVATRRSPFVVAVETANAPMSPGAIASEPPVACVLAGTFGVRLSGSREALPAQACAALVAMVR